MNGLPVTGTPATPPLAVTTSPLTPMPIYSPTSVWTTPVEGSTAIDPSSRGIVTRLVSMVDQEEQGGFGPWINTTSWSVPVYSVAADQPRVRVQLDVAQSYAQPLQAALSSGVPIPPGAQPAAGSDATLVIWQPATETQWEFWHAHLVKGTWHAAWGGVMTNVLANPGYYSGADWSWGATATSLASTGGLLTPAELQSGAVNHALALAIPLARAGQFASPAQRTDGQDTSPNSIPEGAHFRLDPALNIYALGLPPVTLALARAAQLYGIVVRDRAAEVTFFAQDTTPTGTDPYPLIFGGQTPATFLASFPWAHLQLLRMSLHSNG